MIYYVFDKNTKKIKFFDSIMPEQRDDEIIIESDKKISMSAWLDDNNNIVIEKAETDKTYKYKSAIQDWLDSKAREHGYDNIISACSYAGYTNPFQDEAKRFIKWRGSVWETAYQIMQDVENGDREPPATPQDLISELPTFEDTTLEE